MSAVAVLSGVVLAAVTGSIAVMATKSPIDLDVMAAETGTRASLSSVELRDLQKSYFKAAAAKGPFHDYKAVSVCGNARPDVPDDGVLCTASWALCRFTSGGGQGPALIVYRRVVNRAGTPLTGPQGQWQRVGPTCWPNRVPGAGNVLTMAMIEKAFHETEFAAPTVNIQPEGDVTLVNLATYFEVRFPAAGFEPDEVDNPDPRRLLGYPVQIRPRLKEITYHLGERTIGPTRDLGGPYPSGTIVHTYSRPGQHQVRADIVYTGQFRIGHGDWIDIPGEVTIEGTETTLTVREARSRLYTP